MVSEISSSGDLGLWLGTNKRAVVRLADPVLTPAACFFLYILEARLDAAVDLSSGF